MTAMSRIVTLAAGSTLVLALSAGSCGQPSPQPERTVQPGAFCDTAGEVGRTKTGTPMVCKGPGELRWRQR